MARYRVGPVARTRANDDWYPDGETRGDMVHDDGSWSEDQPTGILAPDGGMIWRCRTPIGYVHFDD